MFREHSEKEQKSGGFSKKGWDTKWREKKDVRNLKPDYTQIWAVEQWREVRRNIQKSDGQAVSQPSNIGFPRKSQNPEILIHVGNMPLILMWSHRLQNQNLSNKCICISLNQFPPWFKDTERTKQKRRKHELLSFSIRMFISPTLQLKSNWKLVKHKWLHSYFSYTFCPTGIQITFSCQPPCAALLGVGAKGVG